MVPWTQWFQSLDACTQEGLQGSVACRMVQVGEGGHGNSLHEDKRPGRGARAVFGARVDRLISELISFMQRFRN